MLFLLNCPPDEKEFVSSMDSITPTAKLVGGLDTATGGRPSTASLLTYQLV